MNEDPGEWTYLGDGVYANFDELGVWLHTNDHEHPTDRIYLEDRIIEELHRLYQKVVAKAV
jgi:hypothetical protein